MRVRVMVHLGLVSLLFLTSFAFAEIRETASMAEAMAEVDEETLLIFDLDNTIMKPAQTLGTDQWYDHLVKEYVAEGDSTDVAIGKAIVLWTKVQKATKVSAVEAVTPELIKREQNRGITVMALTARPLDLIPATKRQLKSISVDFTKSPIHRGELEFEVDDVAKLSGGILFVGPKNNKGKVLVQFLKEQRISPKRIVFVDDKVKHVNNMESAMKEAKIEYLGFRYGVTDEEVKNFDREIAEIQLRFFEGIVDDASAEAIRSSYERDPRDAN